jgi:hypothetical protein
MLPAECGHPLRPKRVPRFGAYRQRRHAGDSAEPDASFRATACAAGLSQRHERECASAPPSDARLRVKGRASAERGRRPARRAHPGYCPARKQASGLVRPSLFARSCLRPTRRVRRWSPIRVLVGELEREQLRPGGQIATLAFGGSDSATPFDPDDRSPLGGGAGVGLSGRAKQKLVGSSSARRRTSAASGRPGALRLRAPLSTGRFRFRASGSSKPWQVRWRDIVRSAR